MLKMEYTLFIMLTLFVITETHSEPNGTEQSQNDTKSNILQPPSPRDICILLISPNRACSEFEDFICHLFYVFCRCAILGMAMQYCVV